MTRSELVSAACSTTTASWGSTSEASDASYAVVWLRGEFDIATRGPLMAAIAGAERRDGAHVLIDLSEITFMDASTIGVLIGFRNRLAACSRSLHLRAPSPVARRIIEVCGLAELIHRDAREPIPPPEAMTSSGTSIFPRSDSTSPSIAEQLRAVDRNRR